jgi:hypothetical protein
MELSDFGIASSGLVFERLRYRPGRGILSEADLEA